MSDEMMCVRCGQNPMIRDFICADCLYDDYEHAREAWGKWQRLAEDAIDLLSKGLSDYGDVIELQHRRNTLML